MLEYYDLSEHLAVAGVYHAAVEYGADKGPGLGVDVHSRVVRTVIAGRHHSLDGQEEVHALDREDAVPGRAESEALLSDHRLAEQGVLPAQLVLGLVGQVADAAGLAHQAVEIHRFLS